MLDNYTLSKQFFISDLYGKNYHPGWIPTTQTACETGIHRENDYHSYPGEQLVPPLTSEAEGALLPSHVWQTEEHACAYSSSRSTCLESSQKFHILVETETWTQGLAHAMLPSSTAWGREVDAGFAIFLVICEPSFIASCKYYPHACLNPELTLST